VIDRKKAGLSVEDAGGGRVRRKSRIRPTPYSRKRDGGGKSHTSPNRSALKTRWKIVRLITVLNDWKK